MSGATKITEKDVREFVEAAGLRCHYVLDLRRLEGAHSLSWPGVHRLVARLEAANLVRRDPHGLLRFKKDDFRAVWVKPGAFVDGA